MTAQQGNPVDVLQPQPILLLGMKDENYKFN